MRPFTRFGEEVIDGEICGPGVVLSLVTRRFPDDDSEQDTAHQALKSAFKCGTPPGVSVYDDGDGFPRTAEETFPYGYVDGRGVGKLSNALLRMARLTRDTAASLELGPVESGDTKVLIDKLKDELVGEDGEEGHLLWFEKKLVEAYGESLRAYEAWQSGNGGGE